MARKRILGLVAAGVLATGVVILESVAGRRLSRRLAHAVTGWARYRSGQLEGFRYRLAGRRPDPTVEGPTLADRVRSTLGPVEHRLDLPHVHVMAEGHDVHLHGDVATPSQAGTIVEATRRVSGVGQVHSHLHVGLLPSDTRPSEGSRHRDASLSAGHTA